MARSVRLSRADWLVAACVVTIWLLPSTHFPDLNNPNEQARIYTTQALVEHGTYAVDAVIAAHGPINDLAVNTHGMHYAAKAPGAALLAAPLYAVVWHAHRAAEATPSERTVAVVSRLGGSVLPMLAFLALFAHRSRQAFPRASIGRLGLAALACGSSLLPYGVLLTSHATAAAAVFAAFLLVEDHRGAPRRLVWPLGAGALLGVSGLLEYPTAIAAAIVWAWGALRSPERASYLGWTFVGALLPLLLLAHFHWAAFGNPLTTPYAHLANPGYREMMTGGYPGIGTVRMEALATMLLSPSTGLFWFVPWTLPVAIWLPFAASRADLRRHTLVPLVVFVSSLFLLASLPDPRGGWTVGPRYVVPVLPFLAWALQSMVAGIRSEGRSVAVLIGISGLIGAATFANVLSAAMYPHYPEAVVNPVHEIALLALRHGFLPHHALEFTGIGAAGALTLLALASLVLALAAAASWEPLSGVERASCATVSLVAAFLLLRWSALPTTPDAERLERAQENVLRSWSPRRTPLADALAVGALPESVLRSADPDELEHAAQIAASEGYVVTAITLHTQARALRAGQRAASAEAR